MPSLTFDDLSTRMFNLEWEQRISKEAYKRVLQEHKQSQQEHKQSQQEHKQSQQEHKQSQQELKQSLQEYKRLTTEIKDIQDAIHLYTVTHNKEGQVKIPDAELKVNYFSTGLGARIDVLATSSTRRGNDGFLASIYRSLFSIPGRRPPITALQAWKEPGDCWCAAATDPERIGRAQLAVVLAFPVFPTQVTVEHLRSDAAPGKKVPTAPKSMELWVKTSEPLQRQSLSCLGDGPKGYVCLGTFEYNILGSNNVQTFDLERMSVVPVTRAILRVTSTWGSDNACLYRVRLHGDSPDVPNEDGSGDW
ncbi:hypothetical protein K505DRAFT_137965 [Melanomma pulvis-pyrius CBS 109.77]|uniref:SUN domain-containing protein n=1 Tax=Melanomma pulvis-pyrius CBS 109.77 TaxID=1314802 RepID=A0A6A6WRT3_9PLEO|nr:hypothetical protein K505DRAFT_137965 [Melanomma pulvis-pyrius CBS 109.77]